MASLAQSIKFSIQKSPKISSASTFAGRSNLAGNLVAVLRSNKPVVSLASKFEILPEKRLSPVPVGLSGKGLKFSGWDQLLRQRGSTGVPVTRAAADDQEIEVASKRFGERYPALVTGFFFFAW